MENPNKKPSLGSIPQTPVQASAQLSSVQAAAPTPTQSVLQGMQGKTMAQMMAEMEAAQANLARPAPTPAPVATVTAPTAPAPVATVTAPTNPNILQRAGSNIQGYMSDARSRLSGLGGTPAAVTPPATPAAAGDTFRQAVANRAGSAPIPAPTNVAPAGAAGDYFKATLANKPVLPPPPVAPTLVSSASKFAGGVAKALAPADIGYAVYQDQQNPELLKNIGEATGVESSIGQRLMGGLATVGDKAWELGELITAPVNAVHELFGATDYPKMPSGADSPIGKLRGAPVPNMFVDGFNALTTPDPAAQATEAKKATDAVAARTEAAKQSLLDYSNIGSVPAEQIAQMQAQMKVDPNLVNKGNNIFQERGTNNFVGVGSQAKPMTSEQARLAAASTPEAMLETMRKNRIANRPDDWNSNSSELANMAQRTNKMYDEMQASLDSDANKFKMGKLDYAREKRAIEESRISALQGFNKQTQDASQAKAAEKLGYAGIDAENQRVAAKDTGKGGLTEKDMLKFQQDELDRADKLAEKTDKKLASGAERFDKALQAKFVDDPKQYNKIKKHTAQLEPALLDAVYAAGPGAVDLLVSDMDNVAKYTDARNQSANSVSGDAAKIGLGTMLGGMFPKLGAGVGMVGDGLLKAFPATRGLGKAGVLKKALGTRLGGAAVGGVAGGTGFFGMMPDSIPESQMLDLPKLNEAGTGLDMGNSALSLPKVLNDPIGSAQARLGMAGMATSPSGAIVDLGDQPDVLNSILRIQQMRANLNR